MKIKSILFSFLAFVFFFVSCNTDEDEMTQVQETGTLTGKVLAKNGEKPIGNALVFVLDGNKELYYTYTDQNGNFSFKAPIGERTLQLQTGNGTNFRTTIAVTVLKDQTIIIDQTLTQLDQVASMAYVVGEYDDIQSIVTSLEYDIDMITNADLANYATISQYDIIFLNCGAKEPLNQEAIDVNLANFVTNGGSLYASDWAVAYLTGGASNSIICGEAGGFIPDDKLCSTSTGSVSTINGAQITNTSLAAAMGFATLNIDYDLGAWQKIINYDATYWDVLVKDPLTNSPLMIKTNNFSSGTISTPVGNNGNDGWVTICHNPSGNNPITITINENALPAHLAHGDSLGECSNSNNSGTIYYTTFHNHAGGNITNAGLILEYVILNL